MSKTLLISSPTGRTWLYRRDFSAMGGRWHPDRRTWTVPAQYVGRVERIAATDDIDVVLYDPRSGSCTVLFKPWLKGAATAPR